MKTYEQFINESISIHKGDFRVTEDMVSNGMLIKELIPREVTGSFECDNIGLTSLVGSPHNVGESFYCENNQLLSLYGGPSQVEGSFDIQNNNLISLEGSPEIIKGSFDCYNNKLTSLKDGPVSVGDIFYCNNNKLVSLEYGPKNFKRLIKVDNGLETEKGFIESGQYINEYWMDLLKYMISNHIELTEIKSWPKDFLNDELIRSAKGISKFKL